MRWWLNTDHKAFAVDNSSVNGGMDFSALPPDIWMVQWTDGRGEIEHQTLDGENLNGLRENFVDVIPYAPYFKQFLSLLPGLTLDQAKKIQIELINTIFDSKRQMPFHYVVATGDFWWDASDTSMAAASLSGVQNATAKVDEIAAKLNALVADINSRINDANNNVVITNGNSSVSTAFIGAVNGIVNEINNQIVVQGSTLTYHVNETMLGLYQSAGGIGGNNNLNNKLRTGFVTGLDTDIAHTTATFSYVDGIAPGTYASINYLNGISWDPIGGVVQANVQWIPIGATAPVDVATDEQQAILSGISERTNELNLIRNQKNAAVNALTTIASVIAYDVTTGWPPYTPPPGFQLWQPMSAAEIGSSMVFVGTGDASGGGVPEAPSDDVTYGRRNQVWNPALAKSGDVLDGGSF